MADIAEELDEPCVPTLVEYAQRVAGLHSELIESLGTLRFDLIQPILEKCTAEQLEHFEDTSPQIQGLTQDAWRAACLRKYITFAVQYEKGEDDDPLDWKAHYYFLADEASRRMDDITSKLRTDRVKQEERKRDKEVKLTDRLPPAKRQRWGQTQQKTLFQRTRTEASRVSKTTHQTRMFPNAKKIVPNSLAARVPILAPPFAPGTSTTSAQPSVPVTVTIVRRPNRDTASASSSASVTSSTSVAPSVLAASSSSRLSSSGARLPVYAGASPVSNDLRVASTSNHVLVSIHATSASSVRPSLAERRSSSTAHSSASAHGKPTPTKRTDHAPVATSPFAPKPFSAAPVFSKSVPFANCTPQSGLPSASSPPPGQPLKNKVKDPMSLLFMPKRRAAPVPVLTASRTR